MNWPISQNKPGSIMSLPCPISSLLANLVLTVNESDDLHISFKIIPATGACGTSLEKALTNNCFSSGFMPVS